MAEWPSVPLRDLVDERGIRYGIVQPGRHVDGGRPIVRVNAIRDGRIDDSNPLCVAPEVEEQYRRTRLQGGELLLTLVGTVGQTAIVPASLRGWNTARAVGVLPIMQEIGARWVHFCLSAPTLQEKIRTWCNTTVQATLNLRDVARLEIPLPPAPTRAAIADLLGALDDKIELNRRMNDTLEAMARALFRSWFVDFDPVRAKMEGRAPVAMDAETAALFPDSFEDSELGGIPRGWPVGRLDEVVVMQRGFDLPQQRRIPGAFPVVQASGPSTTHAEFRVRGPGVTTGRSGKLGEVFLILEDFWPLNTTLWVREYPTSSPYHAYFLLQTLDLEALNAGSAVPTLNRNHVHGLPTLVAPACVVSAFDRVVAPLYVKRSANREESVVLRELRDLLLPKLLSGELRVKDAEKQLEAVA